MQLAIFFKFFNFLSFYRFLQPQEPRNFLKNICNFFSSFLNFLVFFSFFRHKGSRDLLQGLMISCPIVSRVNGMVIDVFITPDIALASFWYFFFQIVGKFHVYGSLSQWNFLKLAIGILASLLKHWNGFDGFKYLNFSKILLKFAIVFKIFEYFCPFLSLIITGQRSFSSLADGLLDINL